MMMKGDSDQIDLQDIVHQRRLIHMDWLPRVAPVGDTARDFEPHPTRTRQHRTANAPYPWVPLISMGWVMVFPNTEVIGCPWPSNAFKLSLVSDAPPVNDE